MPPRPGSSSRWIGCCSGGRGPDAYQGKRTERRRMRISIVTIFPDMFPAFLGEGMVRIAREKGLLEVDVVNLRDFTKDRHRTTDDAPFGGGVGMVMLAEPLFRAVEAIEPNPHNRRVLLGTPQGKPFTQDDA